MSEPTPELDWSKLAGVAAAVASGGAALWRYIAKQTEAAQAMNERLLSALEEHAKEERLAHMREVELLVAAAKQRAA